jgi:hypothetical protein
MHISQRSVTIHHFGAIVAINLQVRAPAMLLLTIIGNWKIKVLGDLQWHNVHTEVEQNPSRDSQI